MKSDLGNPQRNYSLFLHLKERNPEIGFGDQETKKPLDSFQLYLGLVMDQKFALEGFVLLVSMSVHSKESEMGPMFGHSKVLMSGPIFAHSKVLDPGPMFVPEGTAQMVSMFVHSKALKTGPMSVHLKALGSGPMFVQEGTVDFRLKFGHWRAGFPPQEFPPVLVVVSVL